MVIVAGHLQVDPAHREEYLASCREVIVLARAARGCRDFALSADLIDPGRINVFEQWESAADVEAFRGEDPAGPAAIPLLGAEVEQYEVLSAEPL